MLAGIAGIVAPVAALAEAADGPAAIAPGRARSAVLAARSVAPGPHAEGPGRAPVPAGRHRRLLAVGVPGPPRLRRRAGAHHPAVPAVAAAAPAVDPRRAPSSLRVPARGLQAPADAGGPGAGAILPRRGRIQDHVIAVVRGEDLGSGRALARDHGEVVKADRGAAGEPQAVGRLAGRGRVAAGEGQVLEPHRGRQVLAEDPGGRGVHLHHPARRTRPAGGAVVAPVNRDPVGQHQRLVVDAHRDVDRSPFGPRLPNRFVDAAQRVLARARGPIPAVRRHEHRRARVTVDAVAVGVGEVVIGLVGLGHAPARLGRQAGVAAAQVGWARVALARRLRAEALADANDAPGAPHAGGQRINPR